MYDSSEMQSSYPSKISALKQIKSAFQKLKGPK